MAWRRGGSSPGGGGASSSSSTRTEEEHIQSVRVHRDSIVAAPLLPPLCHHSHRATSSPRNHPSQEDWSPVFLSPGRENSPQAGGDRELLVVGEDVYSHRGSTGFSGRCSLINYKAHKLDWELHRTNRAVSPPSSISAHSGRLRNAKHVTKQQC